MIKWNGPGVLYHKGRKFKAGSEIPAGILSPDRLAEFVQSKKIKIVEFSEPKELKPEVKNTIKPVQTEQVYENGVKKLKLKKTQAEIEEEELLKAIEEEELLKKSDPANDLIGGQGAKE